MILHKDMVLKGYVVVLMIYYVYVPCEGSDGVTNADFVEVS